VISKSDRSVESKAFMVIPKIYQLAG
jgi:hypothetical protein